MQRFQFFTPDGENGALSHIGEYEGENRTKAVERFEFETGVKVATWRRVVPNIILVQFDA